MIEIASILFFSCIGIAIATSKVHKSLHYIISLLYLLEVFYLCSFNPLGFSMGMIQFIGIVMTAPLFLLGFYYRQLNIVNRNEYVLRFMADGEPKNKGGLWDKPVSFLNTFRFRLFMFIFGILLISISHIYA